jgi:hypothetical protein
VADRETRFDNFEVSTNTASRFGARLAAAAKASCSLRDLGYGASVGYGAHGWTLTVSGSWNDYDTIECGFDVAVPTALLRLDRAGFEALAGSFLNRAVARSGGRIGEDTRLLQSAEGVTLAYDWDKVTLQLDYQRSRDEFGGATQDAYSVTSRLAVTTRVALDIVLGTTVRDSAGTPYMGLYVSASL